MLQHRTNSLCSHIMQYMTLFVLWHCLFYGSSLHGLKREQGMQGIMPPSAPVQATELSTILHKRGCMALRCSRQSLTVFPLYLYSTLQPVQAHKITGLSIICFPDTTFLITEF